MRTQRKRVPVTFMAGSSFTRSLQKPPQAPASSVKVIPILPQWVPDFLSANRGAKTDPVRVFHGLFGGEPPAQEKILTIDDVAPVALPKCSHGVRLSKDEYIFEHSYKKKFHLRVYGQNYLIPVSFNCFECNPTCQHGCELSKTEDTEAIQNKNRFSKNCPECCPSITNQHLINLHLQRKGLNVDASRGLLEGCIVTKFGQVITHKGRYFSLRGGAKEIEDFDAHQMYGSDSYTVGHGSDDPKDVDGITTDDLGDPIWSGLSDASKHGEKIRSRETKDTLWLPIFEVRQDSPGKWYILKDGSRVAYKNGEAHWFKTKRAAELYTNRLIIQEEVIEHDARDVLALIQEPETDAS